MKAPSRTFAYRGGNSEGEGDQEVTEDRQGLFFPLSSCTGVPRSLCVCVRVCALFYRTSQILHFLQIEILQQHYMEQVYQCHFSKRLR